MVQRYNPDYVMHAARFEPFARENEHGEYVKFSDYEILKAELDALANRVERLSGMLTESRAATKSAEERADALAVENASFKHALSVILEHVDVTDKGQAGVVAMIANDELFNSETPATDTALAAIEARGVEKFAKALRVKGDDAFFDAIAEAQANAADEFAAKLREAK